MSADLIAWMGEQRTRLEADGPWRVVMRYELEDGVDVAEATAFVRTHGLRRVAAAFKVPAEFCSAATVRAHRDGSILVLAKTREPERLGRRICDSPVLRISVVGAGKNATLCARPPRTTCRRRGGFFGWPRMCLSNPRLTRCRPIVPVCGGAA